MIVIDPFVAALNDRGLYCASTCVVELIVCDGGKGVDVKTWELLESVEAK